MITVGALTVLALAGCGKGQHEPVLKHAPASTSSAVVPSPITTVPDPASGSGISTPARPPATGGPSNTASRHEVPAGKVDDGRRSAPVWTTDGGRTLGTTVEKKGCETVRAAIPEQSASRVVMVVTTTDTAKRGQMCPMYIANVPVTAHLAAPLGNRTVVLQMR
ncbi:MAG: hypothetical protein ACRDRN_26955 [Sciscionella sp.]